MLAVSVSEMEWIAEAMVSNDECEGAPCTAQEIRS
jgi:hypothetical protein